MRRLTGLILLLALFVGAGWLIQNGYDRADTAGETTVFEPARSADESVAPPDAAEGPPTPPAAILAPGSEETAPPETAETDIAAAPSQPEAAAETPSPAPEAATAEAPAAEEPAPDAPPAADSVPTFDVVRVEPSGDTVIAGLAPPDAKVEVLDGAEPVATAEANERGEWALVLETPLPPGTHDLAIRTTSPDKSVVTLSDQRVAVSVPEGKGEAPLVVLNAPKAPSKVMQVPAEPEVAAAPETPSTSEAPATATAPQPPTTPEPPTPEPATPPAAPGETEIASVPPPAAEPAPEPAAPPTTPEMPAPPTATAPEATPVAPEAPPASGTATTEEPAPAPSTAPTAPAPGPEVAAAPPQGEEPAAAAPEAPPSAPPAAAEAPPAEPPVVEEPKPPEPKIGVAAVEAETNGALYIAGTATTSEPVRVYVDDELVGEVTPTEGGTWLIETNRELPPGEYKIRADQVEERSGSVIVRAEVPFDREIEVAVLKQSNESADPGAAELSGSVAGPMSVIIKRGDNLWRISREMYGHGVRYSTIYQANKDQIRNPNRIYPGQVFILPAGDTAWQN